MAKTILDNSVFKITVRYLSTKNGLFFYYRRVPKELRAHHGNRTFIRKSLKTRELHVATKRAAALAAEHDALWASLRSQEGRGPRPNHPREPQSREGAPRDPSVLLQEMQPPPENQMDPLQAISLTTISGPPWTEYDERGYEGQQLGGSSNAGRTRSVEPLQREPEQTPGPPQRCPGEVSKKSRQGGATEVRRRHPPCLVCRVFDGGGFPLGRLQEGSRLLGPPEPPFNRQQDRNRSSPPGRDQCGVQSWPA